MNRFVELIYPTIHILSRKQSFAISFTVSILDEEETKNNSYLII